MERPGYLCRTSNQAVLTNCYKQNIHKVWKDLNFECIFFGANRAILNLQRCIDIKTYETTINSIGYVVAKYSIGYDFNKLDYMCLSDPKLSIQDIKQCIGRGIRPDELGVNGSNKEKILNVSLPVYIDDNGDNADDEVLPVSDVNGWTCHFKWHFK